MMNSTAINPCDLQPCQNGGTCSPGIGLMYTCECTAGYEGNDCEIGTFNVSCSNRFNDASFIISAKTRNRQIFSLSKCN